MNLLFSPLPRHSPRRRRRSRRRRATRCSNRCAAVEHVAAGSPISGEYLVSDTVDDCGGRLGELASGRTGDAPWRWASVTKQIVAVAVMQQVEAGKVALDTPVAAYVPALESR